jgi:hypothetical protein
MDRGGTLDFMDCGRRRMDMRNQVRDRGLARFTHVHHVSGPLRIPLVTIPRFGIIGRFDSFGRSWQLTVRLPPYARTGALPRRRIRGRWLCIVVLPGPAQRRDARERPHGLRGVRRLHCLQDTQTIFTDGLRLRLPGRFGAGKTRVLDALAIALIPGDRRERLQPVGSDRS